MKKNTIMNNKADIKYRLDETDTIMFGDRKLYRIVALRNIGDRVKAGDKGGYIESENNLWHFCDAWVYDNAKVYGNAFVYDNAKVSGDAFIFGFA